MTFYPLSKATQIISGQNKQIQKFKSIAENQLKDAKETETVDLNEINLFLNNVNTVNEKFRSANQDFVNLKDEVNKYETTLNQCYEILDETIKVVNNKKLSLGLQGQLKELIKKQYPQPRMTKEQKFVLNTPVSITPLGGRKKSSHRRNKKTKRTRRR